MLKKERMRMMGSRTRGKARKDKRHFEVKRINKGNLSFRETIRAGMRRTKGQEERERESRGTVEMVI